MKITVNKYAGPSERFVPGCLDGQVGEPMGVRAGAFYLGTATIVDYEVINEGREILVSLDVDIAGLRPKTINLDSGLDAGR